MGMWQGILAGYQNAQERRLRREELALEREKFERALLERRRDAVMERLRNNLAESRAERELMDQARQAGLEPTVIGALARTGELSTIMESIEASDVIDREYIQGLNGRVMEALGDQAEEDPDSIAAAILRGVNTGRDVSDPYQAQLAAMEAVYSAENIEDLQAAEMASLRLGTGQEGMDPFGVAYGPIEGVDTTVTGRMRSDIIERVAPYLGDSVGQDLEGRYYIRETAPSSVTSLIDRMADDALERVTAVGNNLTEPRAVQEVTRPITTIFETARTLPVDTVWQNYEEVVTNPESFLERIMSTPSDVPTVDTPPSQTAPLSEIPEAASATEAMGELRTPGSAFAFDLDEAMRIR
jgi:hypothetical protein